MKNLIRLISTFILLTFFTKTYSQEAIQEEVSNNAKIVFMRSTGFNGSASAFTTFIDDQLVCRLNNKRFSTHIVSPGQHTVSVQFAGKSSKEKAERISIEVEGGKTYYVQLIFQPGMFVNNLYCQEVTKSSANLLLPKLQEDTSCL
jgi:uncharacterized alpha/beta hydrolase family protein